MWRNYILLATLIGMFSKGIATDAPLVVIGFRTPEEAYIAKAMLELHTDTAVLKQYAHRAGYAVATVEFPCYFFTTNGAVCARVGSARARRAESLTPCASGSGRVQYPHCDGA